MLFSHDIYIPCFNLFGPFIYCWTSNYKLIISGGYDMEEKAARAYDLAALKYWGPSTHINFPVMFFSFLILISPVMIWFSFHVPILLRPFSVLFLIKCNYCVVLAGKLSKRTWRNEEYEQAGICCSLEKVNH